MNKFRIRKVGEWVVDVLINHATDPGTAAKLYASKIHNDDRYFVAGNTLDVVVEDEEGVLSTFRVSGATYVDYFASLIGVKNQPIEQKD